jgi:hypothetical protein
MALVRGGTRRSIGILASFPYRGRFMKFVVRIVLIVSFAFGDVSLAAYRCKDAQGRIHFSSSIPAECQGRDIEVLSDKGTVTSIIESEESRVKTAAREAEEAQRLKGRNEQMQRDRVLLETYLAVADIERLRDQRIELLEAQLKIAEQHIGTLNERLGQLRQQAARFKPYSDTPNAPPLPDHLAEALINTLKSVEVDRETIRHKRNEQAELAANFERDIKRFKELKSLK